MQYFTNEDYDDIDEYDYNTCQHGIYRGYLGECSKCNQEEDENGGLDKCLNCGRYKWGNQLNKDQCCIVGCINPNEY